MLEAGFEYSKESQDLLIDYRLAPEKTEIKESMLLNLCKVIAMKNDILVSGVKKPVPTYQILSIIETCNYIYN